MDAMATQEYNVPDSYRDRILKWNGWGYADSYFEAKNVNDVVFTGNRYEMSGKRMPYLRKWFEDNMGVELDYRTPSVLFEDVSVPDPINNQPFNNFLLTNNISHSNKSTHRLIRSHGHTVHDLFHLRTGIVHRVPDVVVWPKDTDEVLKVVEAASVHDVVIIPLGGGTSVSGALECPADETRSICSLDMALMNKILYIDDANMICRAQAGIIGQDLEKQLNSKGFTCGHEPDSVEFSTLGGWVATRASGMKKNKYGNIEDLLVHVTVVTPKGLLYRHCQVPRLSSGPDIQEVILGSEGILGVIIEATVKIFPVPPSRKYGSFVFPTFENGVNFFREVAKQKCQCASLRLVDNEQFCMGQAMKVYDGSMWKSIKRNLSMLYVQRWKNFKINEMVAATCVYEGTAEEIEAEERKLNSIAAKFDGLPGGEENGKYGYRLTFAIAYLRDLGLEFSVMGESFETSVPWDRVLCLCRNVKKVIKRQGKRNGILFPVLATCRVTQVYDCGACAYFYYGFNYRGLSNPLDLCNEIEKAARDEIIACGGSISHHHGVGKLRKQWLPVTIGDTGLLTLRAIKRTLDPKNIFASGNLFDLEEEVEKSKL